MPSASLVWLLDIPQLTLPEPPAVVPSTDNYTDTEIAEAISKLVAGSIRRPYGALGERKTLDAFDDTMDAAAGVFILTPASPFYIILLGTRRLNDDLTTTITAGAELIAAIQNMGRPVKPLTSITSLGNARSALFALENASAQRQSAFEDIEESTAFQRFDKHTDKFLDDAAGSIKVGENIAQTPQQARIGLGDLVSSFSTAVREVQRRARLFKDGIDNYNSLNLPALLAQGVISKTREVLDQRIEQMGSLTPTERLEILRETALDVIAGKAVVKGFGSLTKSGEFVPLEGRGSPFTDDDHPGNPALISSTILDPYSILTGEDSLTFIVDSGPTLTIPLQQSYIAKLEGIVREPFDITAGVNDTLEVTISDSSDIDATLTPGVGRTAAQIVADLNAAVTTGQIFLADTFLAPEKFRGQVDAINASGANIDFQKSSPNWSSLNVEVGDGVIVQTGAMVQVYFLVTARSGTTITCARQGSGLVANEDDIIISVGTAGRFIRMGVPTDNELTSLELSRSYTIPADTDDAATTTLGFVGGMTVSCRRTRADEVANSINSSAAASVGGVARIGAAAEFSGGDELAGRSDVGNASKVVSSLFRAPADVTGVGVFASFAVAGAQTAGVALGHVITIRSSPVTNDVGLRGTVTAVSDTSVSATMVGVVDAATGLELEFGVNLGLARDGVVRVLAPSPVAGDYRVLEAGSNPTEVTLDRPLPLFIGAGGQPLTFQMQVGGYRVDFRSLSTTVDSELHISGTAGEKFFTSVPVLNVGTTPFVLLEKDPKVLAVGDRFELYSGQYQAPEYEFDILGFELGQKLIELSDGVPFGFSEIDFSGAITTPFARIRKLYRNNYDLFKAQLELWLDLAVNQEKYFSDLNRFLNPLIVNDNPPLSVVNTAKIHVQEMTQALQQLQLVLLNYQVDTVPQVDTLIDSFLQRGSDRAVDTLLEARFTDFFGYNSEEVSYLGNTLERLRDVSRTDLPVRRTQRKAVVDQELLLNEGEDPDFEFDQSDIQDNDEPDIPGSFVELPGSNF